MSRANDSATVSDENEVVAADPHAHDPHIKVVKGEPTAEELAAVIAVLASGSGTPPEPREAEQNLWGHPVDRLRYATFSWQRVTLLERTHMRK
ncbi:acyl-CoA carboxylase subunit epsilon [Mycobacterium sp. OAE908]